MNNFDFFITTMPKGRSADYYLGCSDGSVYLDFKEYEEHIYLVRISFDCYGCCDLGDHSIPLDKESSYILKKIFKMK